MNVHSSRPRVSDRMSPFRAASDGRMIFRQNVRAADRPLPLLTSRPCRWADLMTAPVAAGTSNRRSPMPRPRPSSRSCQNPTVRPEVSTTRGFHRLSHQAFARAPPTQPSPQPASRSSTSASHAASTRSQGAWRAAPMWIAVGHPRAGSPASEPTGLGASASARHAGARYRARMRVTGARCRARGALGGEWTHLIVLGRALDYKRRDHARALDMVRRGVGMGSYPGARYLAGDTSALCIRTRGARYLVVNLTAFPA
jgi:hypothetical protein